jgi:hypothetical protein
MVVVCAKLVLLVMMHHVSYFQQLLVNQANDILSNGEVYMLVMKHNQNGISLQ